MHHDTDGLIDPVEVYQALGAVYTPGTYILIFVAGWGI
jgi:hypothetical protein